MDVYEISITELQITRDAESTSVVAGSSVSFNVAAVGCAPLAFKWYKTVARQRKRVVTDERVTLREEDEGTDGGRCCTLRIDQTSQEGDQATYMCVVSDHEGGAEPSQPARLVVKRPVVKSGTTTETIVTDEIKIRTGGGFLYISNYYNDLFVQFLKDQRYSAAEKDDYYKFLSYCVEYPKRALTTKKFSLQIALVEREAGNHKDPYDADNLFKKYDEDGNQRIDEKELTQFLADLSFGDRAGSTAKTLMMYAPSSQLSSKQFAELLGARLRVGITGVRNTQAPQKTCNCHREHIFMNYPRVCSSRGYSSIVSLLHVGTWQVATNLQYIRDQETRIAEGVVKSRDEAETSQLQRADTEEGRKRMVEEAEARLSYTREGKNARGYDPTLRVTGRRTRRLSVDKMLEKRDGSDGE